MAKQINVKLKGKKPQNPRPNNTHRETSQTIIQGKLAEDLDAADSTTEPSKAKMNVWRGQKEYHRENMIDGENEQVDVYNYSTEFSLGQDSELMAVILNGNFQPIVSSSSVTVFKLLSDNFKELDDEDEPYNAQFPDDEDRKVMVQGNWYTGFALKNWQVPCFKWNGTWFAFGEGLLRARATLTDTTFADIMYAGGSASITEEPVSIGGSLNPRWHNLASGHPVDLAWTGNLGGWQIVGIDNEFSSGFWGEEISAGEASYDIIDTVGRDFLDGVPVYCIFDNGHYRVLAAGCS